MTIPHIGSIGNPQSVPAVADAELRRIVASGRASGLSGEPLRAHVLTRVIEAELGADVPAGVVQRTIADFQADPGLRRLVDAAVAQATATRATHP